MKKLLIITILFSFYSGISNTSVKSQISNFSAEDTTFYQSLIKMESNISDASKSEGGENPALRWAWFWRNRVDRYGKFAKYGEQMSEFLKRSNNKSLKSGSTNSWIPIGPDSDPIQCSSSYPMNKLTGVAQATSVWADASQIFTGLNGGGFWKWSSGSSWINYSDVVSTFSVYDIAVDNSGKIYIATGNTGSLNTHDGYGYGVFYSSDGGNTWITDKMTSTPSEEFIINRILIHPSQQNVVYALSRFTLYKSTDGGNSWSNTNAPTLTDDYYIDMDFKANNPNTIFICSRGLDSNPDIPSKLYKTTNGAQTWNTSNLAANLKYASSDPIWMGIATSANDPNAIYAVYRDNSSSYTLQKSLDDGSTWQTPLVDRKSNYAANYAPLQLCISDQNSNNIFIGGVWLYKYNSALNTFDHIGTSDNLHDDFRDIYITSASGTEKIFVGNDAGVAYSEDNGSSWTKVHSDLQGGLFYGISNSEVSNDKLIGGVGDCGTHLFDGSTWSNACTSYGDGGTTLIDYQNDSKMFAMVNKSYYRTLDNGSNWNNSASNVSFEIAPPIIQNLTNGRVYISWRVGWDCKIRYSDDFGSNWSDYTASYGGERLTAMAISKSNPNHFYFATVFYEDTPSGWYITSKIRKTSNDGGDGFPDITSNLGDIIHEGRLIDIEVHPNDPNIVWICFGGLLSGNKVFFTTNGGTSWQNITYTLENFPVMDLEYDHDNHQIYIGTDIGPYYMDYSGNSWTKMGDFPITIITELKLNHNTGKLIAATWGRGLWETSITGHCFDGTNEVITSNTTWSTDTELCNNLIVQSGTLTISGTVTMPFKASITVKSGATLTVNGGIVDNANILVESGGNLLIQNNGKLRINNGDELKVNTGGILNYSYGNIEIISGN